MTTLQVYLVRHPETDWNRQGRYQGQTGRPLSRRGKVSLRAVAGSLAKRRPDSVISSPTSHARALADAISTGSPAQPLVEIKDAWREVDHGNWEGMVHGEVLERFGAEARTRFDDPKHCRAHGGESLADVERRVAASWERLAASARGVVVVVSHATPIRLVLCRCLAVPSERLWRFRIDNGGVTKLGVSGDSTTVEFVNRLC